MKHLPVAGLLAVLGVVTPVRAEPVAAAVTETSSVLNENRTVASLMSRMREQLPNGWKVSYDPKYQWLEIVRVEPVRMSVVLPSGPRRVPEDDKEEPRRNFLVALRVVPYVSRAEYRQLKARNERIGAKLNVLNEMFARQHVINIRQKPPIAYTPRTQQQKKQVAEYKRLEKTLHPLPDYLYRDISLSWAFGASGIGGDVSVDEEPARGECAAAVRTITQMLSRYEK